MNSALVKGIITDCRHTLKYDLDGNAYKDYVFRIGKQQYTAQIKEDFYLQEEMMLLLELKPGSAREVASGYCVKEGHVWGPNGRNLKKGIASDEKYDFLEGKIIEKRKHTKGSSQAHRADFAERSTRISYTIIMENGEFGASRDEGEYLQVGMNIAVVIDKKESVIILDKTANKYLGLSKPYFILFLLVMIGYNGYAVYLNQNNLSHPLTSKVTVVVVNLFLLGSLVLSYLTYRTTSAAKRFLDAKRTV